MKRFAVGYEFLCRIVMMVVVANVAFLVHTLLGLVVVGFFPRLRRPMPRSALGFWMLTIVHGVSRAHGVPSIRHGWRSLVRQINSVGLNS